MHDVVAQPINGMPAPATRVLIYLCRPAMPTHDLKGIACQDHKVAIHIRTKDIILSLANEKLSMRTVIAVGPRCRTEFLDIEHQPPRPARNSSHSSTLARSSLNCIRASFFVHSSFASLAFWRRFSSRSIEAMCVWILCFTFAGFIMVTMSPGRPS